MNIRDLFTQAPSPAPEKSEALPSVASLFPGVDLRPKRDCHVGQHKVSAQAGGLIICPYDYGQKCLESEERADAHPLQRCTGCAWACTDCIVLLKKAQSIPRSRWPWSLKSELRDDALREAQELDAQIPGPHKDMEEYDRTLFEGLFIRYGKAWVNQEMARIIKLHPSYRKG